MDTDKRTELLMEHYKDTFQLILYHWKARNRLFMYVLIILALLVLDSHSPGSLAELVNSYIAKNVEKPPPLQLDVIGTAAWFILMSLVIQYYQRSVFVDREYRYIQRLEEQLCQEMGGDYVTREGRAYFSRTGRTDEGGKRPLFMRAVGPIYVIVFPALLIIFAAWKVFEWGFPRSLIQALNTGIGIVIVVFNILYIIWVRRRK